MSGGVDSSLSALLLKEQGFRVVGIYMKNWSRDLPGMKCPWAEDLADAKRVAVRLGLDFEVWDYEEAYKKRVVDYMLTEFKAGRTPNPDVMCNQEIKFGLFFAEAKRRGADFIATGHYARAENGRLKLAKDANKDQTYFLYRISQEAASQTLFPLADLTKPEVKRLAEAAGLPNARKKESMGVCFVGEVGMKDFLQEYLPVQPGEIRERETNQLLGSHEGAIFYTIGQRHGLYLGGGLPYYVVAKDLARNIVYVSKDLNAVDLWADTLRLEQVFFRYLQDLPADGQVLVRLRHRAPLIPAQLQGWERIASAGSSSAIPDALQLKFPEQIKAPAPGQSAVLYADDICLGGGIIAASRA